MDYACIRVARGVILLAFVLLPSVVWCDVTVNLDRTLTNPDPPGVLTGEFGYAVNGFNGNLLVGAKSNSGGGAAYVINISNGASILKLTSPETIGTPLSFGSSVLRVGSNIVVGDREANVGTNQRTGSAYIFDGQTGKALLTLRDPNPVTFGEFAEGMEFASGRLFINSQSGSTSSAGRVYVFNPTNGQLINTIANPEAGAGGTLFGFDMEEHQGDVFISEPGGFSAGIQSGVVFRFNGQTLAQSLKISDPKPQMGASFGHSMASEASNLLVGAPGVAATGKVGVGEAYLFNADTGALLRTFVNPEPDNSALFGNSVALLGNYAIIGAPGANSVLGGASGNTDVGAAYVFDATTGDFLAKIANPANGQSQEFTLDDGAQEGGLLALGDNLIATSHKTATGVAYVFSVVPEPNSFVLLAFGTLFSLAARFVRLL